MGFTGNEKKLGFGLMRLPLNDPNKAGDIDIEQVKRMVDLFMERGFTYFDTAWMYCGFQSETATKEVLVDRYPRESFTLATKLNAGFFNTLEERDDIFNQQLEKTGAGYFDYYLLHGIDQGSYQKFEKLDCFNWMAEKKAQGLIKTMGFSYHHDAKLLDEILTKHPEMEFVQLQINYLDWESEWIQSRACYEVAVKHNKPVIVMEPVKGGTLANLPEAVGKLFTEYHPEQSHASWAVRFAASLEHVVMVLSGMSNLEQMQDNLSYMEDFKPMSEEERKLVGKAAELLTSNIAVPCTGCSYCTEGCPQHIAIPQYFSLYNEEMRETVKKWTANSAVYQRLTKEFCRAGDCIACGQCETMCPQHLPIVEHLQAVSKHFDR